MLSTGFPLCRAGQASREADIAFVNDPAGQKADQVDAIGELSAFDEQFGCYAQGVEVRTAVLPNRVGRPTRHLAEPVHRASGPGQARSIPRQGSRLRHHPARCQAAVSNTLADRLPLTRLVDAIVNEGGHQCWGDMVTLLATTAMRISEMSGRRVDDVDLAAGLIHVRRQTYPGRGGLVTKVTKCKISALVLAGV